MTTKQQNITIGGIRVRPGESTIINLQLPKLYDWTPMNLPVHVYHSKKPGPVLTIMAAIHGDEINGIEVIRRVLKKLSVKKIAGTLIAIPIVNLYGFLHQDRYLMDRRDLNRAFPGSKKGSIAGRLAYTIANEILIKSTHIIDLHTGSLHRSNLPQVRIDTSISKCKELAEAFGAPVILNATLRKGTMREFAQSHNIPCLVYEAGESLRFNEVYIRTGVKGVLNTMQHLKMLQTKATHQRTVKSALSQSSYWVRSPFSGICHPYKRLGKSVKQGEALATVGNPTTLEEHKIISPLDGIIIGISELPIVHEGAAVFHIACFAKPHLVAEQFEYLQEDSLSSDES